MVAPRASGCLGILPLPDLKAVVQLAHAVRLLNVATCSISETTVASLLTAPGCANLMAALEHLQRTRTGDEARRNRFGARCYWRRVAQAIKHLMRVMRVELRQGADGSVEVWTGHKTGQLTAVPKRAVSRRL